MSEAIELNAVDDALTRYVRPTSYPLAIKMCASLDEVPADAVIPKRDIGVQMPVCQLFTVARRHGKIMALSLEDQQCPLGNLALGFLKPKKKFLDGSFQWSVLPPGKANAAYSQSIKMLEYGKYQCILVAPLKKADFEPHLILIYGNPGQVVRLVQGRLFLEGGFLTSRAGLGGTCSVIVAHTMQTDECQYVLPGSGPRRLAMDYHDEMAFTIPASKIGAVLKGLEESDKTGMYQYPVPMYSNYQLEFFPGYKQLQSYLMEEGE